MREGRSGEGTAGCLLCVGRGRLARGAMPLLPNTDDASGNQRELRRRRLSFSSPAAAALLAAAVLGAHCCRVSGLSTPVVDNLRPNSQGAVVVGEQGFICTSFDGGYNWQEEELASTAVDLRDVFMLDDHSAVAVGGDCGGRYDSTSCGIFRRPPGRPDSGDSMVQWKKMPLGPGQGRDSLGVLAAVTFCNATLGFVVGGKGSILRTADAGGSWNVMASGASTSVDLAAVHCVDVSVILVAGEEDAAGKVLRSKDGGLTWEKPAVTPTSGPIGHLLMRGPKFVIALGRSGASLSDNAGLRWRPAPGNLNLSLAMEIQDTYLSFAENAYHTAAVVGASQGRSEFKSLVQLLDFPLESGRAHNYSARGIRWLEETVEISAKTVALPGAGTDCVACKSVLVAGSADFKYNTDCEGAHKTCDPDPTSGRGPRWCCGPLQLKSGEAGSAYSTALYRNRSSVRVPVGCRDYTTCLELRAISFTTGITTASELAARTTPPPADSSTGPQSVQLKYRVDISSYQVFQLQILVDKLLALVLPDGGTGLVKKGSGERYAPSASATQTMKMDENTGVAVPVGSLQDVVVSLDYAKLVEHGYSAPEVVRKAVQLADDAVERGSVSDLCLMGVTHFSVVEGEWGPSRDMALACDQKTLPNSVAIVLVIALACYVVSGIIMAFLFSLPQTRAIPKRLSVAYILWLLFGIMGVHRFYLKNPKTGLVYMFTGGIFGLGWLADAFLTPQLFNTSRFDNTLETGGFSMETLRNAPRPNYVSRREAIEMLADPRGERASVQRAMVAGDDEDLGHVEANVQDQLDDMELHAPDRKHRYISPVLYPHTAHRFSDLHLREQSMRDAEEALHRYDHVDDHREQVNVVC